jgi:hypothetical protein
VSIAGKRGELSGVPVPCSEDYLLVMRSLDPLGNVMVNDPAAFDDSCVRHVYRYDELAGA